MAGTRQRWEGDVSALANALDRAVAPLGRNWLRYDDVAEIAKSTTDPARAKQAAPIIEVVYGFN
eukprot:2275110-Alexandrium_andersonii.AAC.1